MLDRLRWFCCQSADLMRINRSFERLLFLVEQAHWFYEVDTLAPMWVESCWLGHSFDAWYSSKPCLII